MKATRTELEQENAELRNRLATIAPENAKLRYLLLVLCDELRLPALMPTETPTMRLDYMLSVVDLSTAMETVAKAAVARPLR